HTRHLGAATQLVRTRFREWRSGELRHFLCPIALIGPPLRYRQRDHRRALPVPPTRVSEPLRRATVGNASVAGIDDARDLAMRAHQGRAKATKASPEGVPHLPPPPAEISTYWRPSAPRNVAGEAYPAAGNCACHNSRPVEESKARMRSSIVPAAKTSPPPVASAPPRFGVPVGEMPRSSSSGNTPSGTVHAIIPAFRFTALRVPHGGLWQG